MRLDVLLDDFIGYISRADGKIAPRPQMPPPKLAFQLAKLLQHLAATAPLQALHHLAHRQTWRYGDQQVNVISRYMAADNVDIQAFARLTDQLAQLQGDFATQHRFTIFSDPNQVIFQIVNRMRRFAIAHGPGRIETFQHTLYHTVPAAVLPLAHRTAPPARPAVKTACLKAGVLNPIYRQ
jgi:hypothetical protein